jgi:hypothetical protein
MCVDEDSLFDCHLMKEIVQVFPNLEYLRCYINEYYLSAILNILSKLRNMKSVVFMLMKLTIRFVMARDNSD